MGPKRFGSRHNRIHISTHLLTLIWLLYVRSLVSEKVLEKLPASCIFADNGCEVDTFLFLFLSRSVLWTFYHCLYTNETLVNLYCILYLVYYEWNALIYDISMQIFWYEIAMYNSLLFVGWSNAKSVGEARISMQI